MKRTILTYIRPILRTLALAMLTFMTFSCSGDDGVDGPVEMTCTDIVTFMGNSGSGAVFSFQKIDDSPVIDLTSTETIKNENITPGTRLLINYIPHENLAYTSGPITLLGGYRVTQSPVMTDWINEFDQWSKDKVYIYSAWRSGDYINVHVRLTYSTDPRIFCLAVDPATIDSSWPEMYLVHVMSGDTDNHDRAYYASFDIGEIWSRPGVEGVRMHVANSNLDKQIFTFKKSD